MLLGRRLKFRVVVLENPLARIPLFALTLRPEAAAIEFHIGQLGAGNVGDGRQYIGVAGGGRDDDAELIVFALP